MAAVRRHICLLPVFLSLWMAAASEIDVTVLPKKPFINGTVLLDVSGVTGKIQFSTWYKGNNSEAKNQILTYNSQGTEIPGGQYFAEARALDKGSLEIRNLQKEFSGDYTVSLHDDGGLYQKTVYLQVYDQKVETAEEANRGLSAGAIFGICIGCVAAVVLVGIAIYIGIRKGSEGK